MTALFFKTFNNMKKIIAGILVHTAESVSSFALNNKRYTQIELDKESKRILFSCNVRELKHNSDLDTQLKIINNDLDVYFTVVEFKEIHSLNDILHNLDIETELINDVSSTLSFPNDVNTIIVFAEYNTETNSLEVIL